MVKSLHIMLDEEVKGLYTIGTRVKMDATSKLTIRSNGPTGKERNV
jgi:hypothetical protein